MSIHDGWERRVVRTGFGFAMLNGVQIHATMRDGEGYPLHQPLREGRAGVWTSASSCDSVNLKQRIESRISHRRIGQEKFCLAVDGGRHSRLGAVPGKKLLVVAS